MSERVGEFERGFRTTLAYYDLLLGQVQEFTDIDYEATGGVQSQLSGMTVHAMLVKNANASAPLPGSIVKWGSPGTTVNGNAGADESAAGVVDPSLLTGPALGEKFLMFFRGPVKVLTTGADQTAGNKVKVAATGLSVVSTAGLVADVLGGFGYTITSTTGSVSQLTRTFIHFTWNK